MDDDFFFFWGGGAVDVLVCMYDDMIFMNMYEDICVYVSGLNVL